MVEETVEVAEWVLTANDRCDSNPVEHRLTSG